MRVLAAFALVFAAGQACAGGLEHPDEVDLIRVHPETRQLSLYVLLQDDRLDTKGSIKALYYKLNRYREYVASGRAFEDTPDANRVMLPTLIVTAPFAATNPELQNLAGVRLNFGRRGTDIEVVPHIPGLAARPRPSGA